VLLTGRFWQHTEPQSSRPTLEETRFRRIDNPTYRCSRSLHERPALTGMPRAAHLGTGRRWPEENHIGVLHDGSRHALNACMDSSPNSVRDLLLSLGLLSGALAGCGDHGPSLGCGNALPCTVGCPVPSGFVCTEAGPATEDAGPDAPGCGNAPICAAGCPVPSGVVCTDSGPVTKDASSGED
jgi:hypothetical protein